MPLIGIALSLEERSAPEVVDAAAKAERAGFQAGWLSDHFHPWNNEQGNSPFVWSVLGAISAVTSEIPWETAVTCPTMRIHPAIIAQAAATTETLMPGRFRLGVGTGEALNEHILGDLWPRSEIRLEMLEEAIEVIRGLWEGELFSHRGEYYEVDQARIYSLPDAPPPIIVSAFHPKALELAARAGEGFATTKPDGESRARYRELGGTGPTQGALKCCYGADRDACIETAHRLWANEALPGSLAQILPTPEDFEQASTLVTPDKVAESVPCGPDPDEHIAAVQTYVDAGFDEIYIGHIGPDHDAFIDFYAREVLPQFAGAASVTAGR
jgi:G6PDH family F420-dependent oxidoreductase